MYTLKLEKFEGPLDLLLQLIEQEKMPITEIALGKVTENYLAYLAQHEEDIDVVELADFLTVAAKLLLIKSREILPLFHWEEDEEDGKELEARLKMYKEYWDAAKKMQKMIRVGHFSYSRSKPVTRQEVKFSPPAGVDADNLRDFFAEVVARLEPVIRVPKQVIKDTINIQHKIASIRQAVLDQAQVNFRHLISSSKDRTEVIVNFLAMLELIKQRVITARQEGHFEDIVLVRV